MKLFKFLPLLVALAIGIYFSQRKDLINTPLSSQNKFNEQLEHAIEVAGLNVFNYEYRDYLSEISFLVRSEEDDIKVIVSNRKSAYNQVASLQKLLKEAKIKGQKVKLVDLSLRHPYATLENN